MYLPRMKGSVFSIIVRVQPLMMKKFLKIIYCVAKFLCIRFIYIGCSI